MSVYVYDIEVYKYDWVVVFRRTDSEKHLVIHNNNYKLKKFLSRQRRLISGFNSKGYDQWILTAIDHGANNKILKELNDWIISGESAWEFPFLQYKKRNFDSFDLRDDTQMGLSLKAIEGHLRMNIVETPVPFDLDRPLTPEELQTVIDYCKYDVDATIKLFDLRQNYLNTKKYLGRMRGLDEATSLYATNAKITALYLGAKRVERDDGREYDYPPNLDLQVIPYEVLEFFNKIHDLSIPDEKLFKTSLTITIGGCKVKFAWGGVHGSLTGYHEEATETRVIQNRDVTSLYPSLMIKYKYLSRNVEAPELFERTYDERIEAKHTGDTEKALAFKLPLNTASGAAENRYNDLYDPRSARSMRISGQLFLTELAVKLIAACKTFKLLNFNTDGLMYSVDKDELHKVDEICAAWEKSSRFELETDEIDRVWIKDVNNLLFVQTNGKVKKVGGYLNYGISEKGAWNINNNYTIAKQALAEYFVHGSPPEETIYKSTDIFEFQIIAKAGTMYKDAYHEVDGKHIPVQKVNRVYATKDPRYGKIYKVKEDTDSTQKIGSLPEHCLIDNANELTIDAVDRDWYVDLTYKMIDDFKGIKKNKKGAKTMATTRKPPTAPTEEKETKTTAKVTKSEEKMTKTAEKETKAPETAPAQDTSSWNIYKKISRVRLDFLAADVKKSGINHFAEFKYFELADIVPVAAVLCDNYGLLTLFDFDTDYAYMHVVSTDTPPRLEDGPLAFPEKVTFRSPRATLDHSKIKGMNALQGLGSEETYQRRYLYMMFLDIVEQDAVDATSGKEEEKKEAAPAAAKKSNRPASAAKREAVKKELIDENGNATEIQIKAVKNGLKKLRDKSDTYEPYIREVMKKIKAGLPKTEAEDLLIEIGNKVEE